MKRRLFFLVVILVMVIFLNIFIYQKSKIYDPYRDYQTTNAVFTVMGQVVYPDLFWLQLDQNNNNPFFSFTNRQKVDLAKWRSPKNQHQETDYMWELVYKRHNTTIDAPELSELHDTIKPQSDYMDRQALKNPTALPIGHYRYYLKLPSPLPLQDLFHLLDPFFVGENLSGWERGVLWIPMKTSEKEEDMTIGLRGNIRGDFSNRVELTAGLTGAYMDKKYNTEDAFFKESLSFLAKNSQDTFMAQTCGLFGETFNINFKQRLDYVSKYGCQALGVVIFSDETLLDDPLLRNFEILNIENAQE